MTQINNTPEIKNAVDNLAIAYMANAVIKSRISIEEAANSLAEELGIDQGDTSLRARALREYLGCIVNCFYDEIEYWDSIDELEQSYRNYIMEAMNNYGAACYDLWDTFDNASYIVEYYKLYGDEAEASRYEKYLAA